MIVIIMKLLWNLKTLFKLNKNKKLNNRRLEIGVGSSRIPGFETLNIVGGRHVDYVFDASDPFPFSNDTYDLIYASHVLEHIPWYRALQTLVEWRRVLRPGGELQVWVPDGLKICSVLVDFETKGVDRSSLDGWYKYNENKDPCLWAAGRLFTYGDGKGTADHPNWHRAIYTERFLKKILLEAGFVDVKQINSEDVLGYDHGWISLGMRGVKL